jgi:hypothetical protein
LRAPLGIGAGAIPTDNFYTLVSLQPFLQRARLSIGQKINRLVTLQIYQNGSVALAFAPRPVIHPDDSNRRTRQGTPGPFHYTQNCIGAGVHAELRGKAESCLAAKSVADTLQHLTMAIGLASVGYREAGKSLREDLATTIP